MRVSSFGAYQSRPATVTNRGSQSFQPVSADAVQFGMTKNSKKKLGLAGAVLAGIAMLAGCAGQSNQPVERSGQSSKVPNGASIEVAAKSYGDIGRSNIKLVCDPATKEWAEYEVLYYPATNAEPYEVVKEDLRPGLDSLYGYKIEKDGTVTDPTNTFSTHCDGSRTPKGSAESF